WALGHSNPYVPRETSTVSQNPWLPDQRPADARPLHAETVPGGHAYHNSTAFVVPGAVTDVDWDTMKGNIAESMRMAAMAQEILKRKTPESA
ncbi:MAG: hypothetical protein K0U61_13685, partial [Alphaproteobacteria bacterium]|nr:hypothetical protein [Alphaproteobacteria bacterium]